MVSATDVQECRRRLFVDGAVSPAVLKATMCLPATQRTETIDGAHYWDGGFMGNPPLTPLVDHVRDLGCVDVILVTTTPLHRDGVPRTARQILDRLNEIAFSSALVHEVNAVETLNRLIDDGKVVKNSGLRRVNLHRIDGDADLKTLGIYSKDAPSWDFLVHLRDLGRAAFERAWPEIEAALGKRSSWDSAPLCDQVTARGALRKT
jgi:NTE family protein